MPLPTASLYALSAGLVVLINYLCVILGFSSMLAIDMEYTLNKVKNNQHLSWWPCFRNKSLLRMWR